MGETLPCTSPLSSGFPNPDAVLIICLSSKGQNKLLQEHQRTQPSPARWHLGPGSQSIKELPAPCPAGLGGI